MRSIANINHCEFSYLFVLYWSHYVDCYQQRIMSTDAAAATAAEGLQTFWDVDERVGQSRLLESFTLRRRQTMTARTIAKLQQLDVNDAGILAVTVHVHWILRHLLFPQLFINPQCLHLVHLWQRRASLQARCRLVYYSNITVGPSPKPTPNSQHFTVIYYYFF